MSCIHRSIALVFTLVMLLTLAGHGPAIAASIAIDGGLNDDDGMVNGVVTIASVLNVAPSVDPYDQTASDFHIVAGGQLVLQTDTVANMLAEINFLNLLIDPGASITSDTFGFAPGVGPGGGSVAPNAGGGGGYGGIGGNGGGIGGGLGGGAYGDPFDPTDFGSGGGGGAGGAAGGQGGGIIRISTSGALTLNGTLSAGGGIGSTSATGAGGGGAGGSIRIKAKTFLGSGLLRANGGAGGAGATANGGGGGGGRVAIEYELFNSSTGSVDVSGGVGPGNAFNGQAGTFHSFQVPEPSTLVLSALGLIGLLAFGWRRR